MRPMHKPITRWQAFLIHLGISLVIFLVLAWIIVTIWYPFPFFQYDGGWQGIRIVAGVDLVLGPLLTLIVYKPGKKHLKLDLGIIAFIQAAALAWGVWITWAERPVAVVYAIDHFSPVTAGEIRRHADAPVDLDAFGDSRPVLIRLDMPADLDARQKLLARSLATGIPLYLFTERYRPIDQRARAELQEESRRLLQHLQSEPDSAERLQRFFAEHGGQPGDYLFLPLHARDGRVILVLAQDSLKTVDILEVDVSEYLKNRPTRLPRRPASAARPVQPA